MGVMETNLPLSPALHGKPSPPTRKPPYPLFPRPQRVPIQAAINSNICPMAVGSFSHTPGISAKNALKPPTFAATLVLEILLMPLLATTEIKLFKNSTVTPSSE